VRVVRHSALAGEIRAHRFRENANAVDATSSSIACMIEGTPAITITLPIQKPGAPDTLLRMRSAPLGMRVRRRRASFISAPVVFTHSCRMASARGSVSIGTPNAFTTQTAGRPDPAGGEDIGVAMPERIECIDDRSGDQGMIMWWSIRAGVHVDPHSPANEQIVWMLKGKMEFRLGSEQQVCGQGDVVVIPRGTEHEAWFREDTEVIDFFAPPREDFLLGGKPAYMSEG
jgi:quercetin dioxygenase-like cupin family protein